MQNVVKVFLVVAGLVIAIGLAPLQATAGPQQTPPPQHQQHHPEQAQKPQTPGKMTMDCQAMMASRQKMMEDMKAMDARLDGLVQTMNSATGQAKVDATAAVVSELVTQRKTMRDGMAKGQAAMMQHMMEHMQMGGEKGAMTCPMMKQPGA
jgi:hypothetical protein